VTRGRVVIARLRGLLGRARHDDELGEEIQAHLAMLTEQHVRRGLSLDEARLAARRDFGGVEPIRERCRDQRGWPALESLWLDLRHALRLFRRSPGFAATARETTAVGIAAATGLFSVVHAALLRPFPFADVDRLVGLDIVDKGPPQGLVVTGRQLVALQRSEALEGVLVSNTWDMTLSGRDLPETVRAQSLSAGGFHVLGVPPLLGRVFDEADGPAGEHPERVVVLTHRFWLRHFGGRPEAVGQTLTLNRDRYVVIGVLPRPYFQTGPEIFVPLHVRFDSTVYWGVRARLHRGVTPRMAEQRLQPLFDEFARETPKSVPKGARPLAWRLVEGPRSAGHVPTLLLIFASSMLLLLLACANVSILLLVRGTSRAHEFVVRAAIGAGRGRLMRQLIVESVLLASSGGALGVAASYWGLPMVLRLLPPNVVPIGDLLAVPVNVPILLFSAGLAMASALICGLSPALSLSRQRLTSTRRTTAGVESRRAHHLLLAGQIALTVLLLAGTGAAVRALMGLYRTSLGYDPHNVIVAVINLPENGYTEWASRAAFYERLRTRMADVPHVESVALALVSGVPPRSSQRAAVEVPGRDTTGGEAPILQRVSGHYFATMRIPLVQGRVWSDAEGAGTPHVAVVNRAMARERWPGESPIGRRVRMPDFVTPPNAFWRAAPGSDGWFEIIGVAGDTPNAGLHEPPAPSIYVPYTLMVGDSVNVILRTNRDPLSMTRSLREAVRTVDPNQPISRLRTAEDELAAAGWARERFVTLLLLGFAACALMLAVVGLYSVVSYAVSCRFKEFSIRLALGAGRGRIVKAAVQPAVRAIVAGLVAGLLSSMGLNTVVARWSIGDLNDPVVLAGVSLVLGVAAMLAAAIPASRAASIQPAEALRTD
jgi:predicted permease